MRPVGVWRKRALAVAIVGPPVALALALLWIGRDVLVMPRVASPHLDRQLPDPQVDEAFAIGVPASPSAVWAAVRDADLLGLGVLQPRCLLTGADAGRRAADGGGRIDALAAEGDVTILDEVPGEEIVVGAVGQPWRACGATVRLSPEAFTAFDRPGHARAVFSLSVARQDPGTLVVVAWRIAATDDASRRALAAWWRAAGPAARLAVHLALPALAHAAEARAHGAATQAALR
jgi:hypothetical protein